MSQPTYKELMEQIAELTRLAEIAEVEERKIGIAKAMEIINEYGLTAQDLGFVKVQQIKSKKDPKATKTFPAKKAKSALPALYQDPESGTTWSGRGMQPRWMTGPRDDYLIPLKKEKKAA
jgi:DNA-binding protein H-NS